MNDDVQITCTSIDCPERSGGKCTATADSSLIVQLFLEESNKIEGVVDQDSLQQALKAWEYLIAQPELTPGVVLKTHKILMLHQKLRPNERGYYRRIAVGLYKGGQLIREGMAWQHVADSVKVWCSRVAACLAFARAKNYSTVEASKKETLEFRIKNDHIHYEEIHPFVDGNGRTGRMFMNWTRLKVGLPILVIFADDRQEYYKWFEK